MVVVLGSDEAATGSDRAIEEKRKTGDRVSGYQHVDFDLNSTIDCICPSRLIASEASV